MVSINTNLSSYFVQQQLSKSTYSLDKAIEHMSTGFKINHSSDNAANYAIVSNMSRDISAYDVAADNVAMGADLAAMANDTLDIVNTHLQRIRDILEQASNGTYGEASRKAIQAEIDSRLDEINRVFKNCEYNGIELFKQGILPSTLNINISELNLTSGSFGVNVNGIDYTIELTNDDSLYSIIAKLNSIGVDADFNEESGVFTVELAADKITDNGTGFKEVLGMADTDGYVAEDLKTFEVYTVLESANGDTKLSAAGITDGSFTIIDSDGAETHDAISLDATINELFNQLWTHQISGSISSNGVVTLNSTSGKRISGALAEQLGISVDIVTTYYNGLTVNSSNTLEHSFLSNANSNTTLDKLGVEEGETLVVRNNEGTALYTYTADNISTQTTTLGGLFNNLVNSGYLSDASVNNGIVSLSSDANNYVTGSIADRFGIRAIEHDNINTVGVSQTGTKAVTYTETSNADSDSKLAKLGITSGDKLVVRDNSGAELYTYTADNISIQNTTIGDFLNNLVSEGYLTSADITDGVISLSSGVNNYVTGSIAEKFGIGVNTASVTETVMNTQTSSEAVSFITTHNAESTITLGKMGVQAGDTFFVRDNNGNIVYSYTADQDSINNTTIGSFLNNLVSSGYLTNATISNGIISLSSYTNNYADGTMAERFGINVNTIVTPKTVALSQTSSSSISYDKITTVDADTTLANMGIQAGDTFAVRDNAGNELYTYTAQADTLGEKTIGAFLGELVADGYLTSANLTNGVISLSSSVNNYVTGTIADKFNIGVETETVIETVVLSQTSSESVKYTKTGTIDSNTTLANLGIKVGDTLSVKNPYGSELYSYVADDYSVENTKIGEFLNFMVNCNYISQASITNGVISVSSNLYNYMEGEIVERLGLNISTVTVSTTSAINQTSSDTVTYTKTGPIGAGINLADLGIEEGESLTVKNKDGNILYSYYVDAYSLENQTIGDILDYLKNAGYMTEANVSNGVISVSSNNYNYIVGDIADRLGIGLDTIQRHETVAITATSASKITYEAETNADYNTTFADLGIDTSGDVSVYDENGNFMGSFTMNSSSTMYDFVDSINSANTSAYAYITGGVISITNGYITGNLANSLNMSYANNDGVYESSDSRKLTYDALYTMSYSTTLGDLGMNSASFTMGDGAVVNLNSSDTIYTKLSSAGFQVGINDGIVEINGGVELYIRDMSSNLANALKIQIGENYTYEGADNTYNVNTDSDVINRTGYYKMSASTTLGDLGLSNASFTMNDDTVVSLTSNDNIISKLKNAGLSVSVSDGILTINADSQHFIKNMTSSLADKLNIQAGEGYSYSVDENDYFINNPSGVHNVTSTFTISSTTTLGDLGLNSASFTMNDDTSVTINASDSVFSKLRSSGLMVSLENGIMTINGDENNYIKSMSSDLANLLHLNVGQGSTYRIDTHLMHTNTDSEIQNKVVTNYISSNTTLEDLGLNSASFTMNDDTVVELNSADKIYTKLQDYGIGVSINNGKLTVIGSDNFYIKSMSSNLETALKLEAGENKTYEITSETTHSNTDSRLQQITNTHLLTTTTTLGDLGLNSASFTMNNDTSISISSSDSIYSKLHGAGLNVSIQDGKITIENNGTKYLKSMSSNLAQALKVQAGEGHTYQINTYDLHSNTDSSLQTVTNTHTISTTATLSDFGLTNAVFTMNNNNTITITSSDSIYSKLQSAGLNVRIGMDGKIEIAGDAEHYIKDMSSNLKNILGIQTGEGYTYKLNHDVTYSNSNSRTQTYRSTVSLNSTNASTYRMSDWGLTTDSKIYTNSVAININRSDTVASLISKLNSVGISASVNNEDGTLKFVNTDTNYIASIDTALKNVLGIEVGEGYSYNSYTVTQRSDTTSKVLNENIKHTIMNSATENTLLKDFNRDSLSIEGDLVFEMGGEQKVVNITSRDTISSLIEKLKDIGIKAIFKNQSLSIAGNKNSVLLVDNSSSTMSLLSELLGLQHTDKLENFSCSNDLNALADSIYQTQSNAPSFLYIQAGIHGNDRDIISMDMQLSLGRVTFKAANAKDASKGLTQIDQLISKITSKQTEYGAFANRMESAADSIAVALENLVSSRSTLQDADIAVESSNYIKAQILQQAAATLLATANQIPAIAIQLL